MIACNVPPKKRKYNSDIIINASELKNIAIPKYVSEKVIDYDTDGNKPPSWELPHAYFTGEMINGIMMNGILTTKGKTYNSMYTYCMVKNGHIHDGIILLNHIYVALTPTTIRFFSGANIRNYKDTPRLTLCSYANTILYRDGRFNIGLIRLINPNNESYVVGQYTSDGYFTGNIKSDDNLFEGIIIKGTMWSGYRNITRGNIVIWIDGQQLISTTRNVKQLE